MRYIPEPGIVYDTLSYNTMFFGGSTMRRSQKISGGKGEATDDTFAWYNRFRLGKRRLDPPDELYPFFYYNAKAPSYESFTPIFQYFWAHYDFLRCDTEAFFDSLLEEPFRRACFRFYLGEYDKQIDLEAVLRGETADCLRALSLLSSQGERLPRFVDFFLRFSDLAATLRDYLIDCHERIRSFHRKYGAALSEALYAEYVRQEEAVRRMFNYTAPCPPEEQPFTVHLIDHFVLLCKPLPGRPEALLFFGASSQATIQRWGDYGNLSILSFGRAFGSEEKYDIIRELCKGENTVSQLARTLYISRSTMDRYLRSLHESDVVYVTRRIGAEIYYALNPSYFFVIREVVNRVIDEISESISN